MPPDQSGAPDTPEPPRHANTRLAWQCRRGMLELDLVLQAFLDHHYAAADPAERRAFETLLNYPDPLLLQYVMGHMVPTDPALARVVACLRTPA